MNALVLYDSKYGNTEKIAEAIALVLQEELATRLAAVGEVDCTGALPGIDLLVVGGPTQRHGMSPPLKEVVQCLEAHALAGVKAAAFDTRLHGAKLLTGSAAARLEHHLRRLGAWLVVPAASFIVEAGEGPLAEGELERAREWAREVLHAAGVLTHEHAPA